MKKRIYLSATAILTAALLLFGLTAFASNSSNTATSATVTGTFKSISPDGKNVILSTEDGEQTLTLAQSVWVYRNDHKAQLTDLTAGDKVEIVLNSKEQAAYIKASSEDSVEPTPEATETPEPSATPAPSASTAPDGASDKPDAAASKDDSEKELKGDSSGIPANFEIKIDGKHFKLHVKKNRGTGGIQYEINVKPEDKGRIHLKGEAAAALITDLLSSIDLNSADARSKLMQEIADQYGIDASKLHMEWNVESDNSMDSSSQVNVKEKEHEDEDADKDADKDEDRDEGGIHVKSVLKSSVHGKVGKHHEKEHDGEHDEDHDD